MIGKWITKQDIDDIVFRNRNKEYGAYDLRKRYNRSVTRGLWISVLVCVLPVLALFLYFMFTENSELDDLLNAKYNGLSNADLKYILHPPPPVKPQKAKNPEKIHGKSLEKKEDGLLVKLPDSVLVKKDSSLLAEKEKVTKADSIENEKLPVFFEVEQKPEFPGGISEMFRFLIKNTSYPYFSYINKTQGTVMVGFCVSAKGKIDSVYIVQSVDYLLDNEAIRVVKSMPEWKPGRVQGKPVAVICTIPIVFTLPKP
jgi:periplasmic protein TonB